MRILYRREVRAALREKTIVINSILIPVFLYPFLLWIALSGLMFVMGQTEGFICRVQVRDWPKEHAVLRHKLELDRHLKMVEVPPELAEAAARSGFEREIRNGTLDLLVEFLPRHRIAARCCRAISRCVSPTTNPRNAAPRRASG